MKKITEVKLEETKKELYGKMELSLLRILRIATDLAEKSYPDHTTLHEVKEELISESKRFTELKELCDTKINLLKNQNGKK